MAYDFTKKKKEETTGQGVDYDAGVNDRALQMLRESAAAKRQAAVQPLTQKKNEALNAYLNRGDFKYDFNADALYQQYKDKYIQQGRQAMQDTMGQAAALTGGYGSSYAQSVGQQAYNAHLQNLNDVIPELYQLAYEQHQNKGNELLQQYGLLADQEAEAYARQYQTEQDAVSDYQWQQSFDYQKGRDAVADSQWQQSFDYQKSQNAAAAKAESSKVTKEAAEAMALHGDYSGFAAYLNVPYEQAKTYYLANYGDPSTQGAIDKPIFSHVDDDGNYHYYLNGKEVEFAEGVNPLTGTINPDVQYGTFGITGYQPNNIGGKPLTEAGFTDTINGHEQKVWKLDDGSLWMWDDLKGAYSPYDGYRAVTADPIKQFEDELYFDWGYRTSSEGSKKGIIENKIDDWLTRGKITEDEAATLIAKYVI